MDADQLLVFRAPPLNYQTSLWPCTSLWIVHCVQKCTRLLLLLSLFYCRCDSTNKDPYRRQKYKTVRKNKLVCAQLVCSVKSIFSLYNCTPLCLTDALIFKRVKHLLRASSPPALCGIQIHSLCEMMKGSKLSPAITCTAGLFASRLSLKTHWNKIHHGPMYKIWP